MEVRVKYRVEKSFRDKYTKKDIIKNDIIDVSVERMKELNEKLAGRVIDVIIVDKEIEDTEKENDNQAELKDNQFSKEDLEKMTVNQLKDLAEKNNIELSKARKDEIIDEIINR